MGYVCSLSSLIVGLSLIVGNDDGDPVSVSSTEYLRHKLASFFPEKFGGHTTAEELYKAANVVGRRRGKRREEES